MPESDSQTNERVHSAPAADVASRVSGVWLGPEQVFVLSVPVSETRYPEGATSAEREIIDLLLEGNTLKEIAALRGTSLRTVTTQLAEIYWKAGVHSSRQLAAFTTGVDGPWID